MGDDGARASVATTEVRVGGRVVESLCRDERLKGRGVNTSKSDAIVVLMERIACSSV